MRHSPEGLGIDLGGADIEATIELHGIRRNDLASKRFGQGDGQIGLSSRSRPDDDDEWGRVGTQGLSRP